MDGAQFRRQGSRFRQASTLQVGLHQGAQSVGMAVEVGYFFQVLDCSGHVAGIESVTTPQQQCMTVAGIERQHAVQNFFRRTELATSAQAVGGGGEKLPCFRFLIQPDIHLGQPGAHGNVFRIHLQRLLENPYSLFQFSGAQKFFGYLQILRPCIIKESLLGIELGQPQYALQGGLQLGELLVHGDGFDGEALCRIGVANALEGFDGLVALAETGVEVTNGVGDGQFLGVSFEYFFVLGDGILQLALLDELLRSAESFLFVEAKTKRHKLADSSSRFISPPENISVRRVTDGLAIRSAMSADHTRDGLSDKGHCKTGYQESYGY